MTSDSSEVSASVHVAFLEVNSTGAVNGGALAAGDLILGKRDVVDPQSAPRPTDVDGPEMSKGKTVVLTIIYIYIYMYT